MSFEYYYITIVSLVILVVAVVIAVILNEGYRKAIIKYLSQAGTSKGGTTQVVSGDVEVLLCPRCGYSVTIPFRVGDYVGKVVSETCPRDGERLVVHAIYSTRHTEAGGY